MDDLVQYYRRLSLTPHLQSMERRMSVFSPPFIHLDVEACLRATPLPLAACLLWDHMEIEERPWESRAFNYMGILRLCLLGCPPFHGLAGSKIRDVRPKVPYPLAREHDCPQRPHLFDGLAAALWDYERQCSGSWEEFSETLAQGGRSLQAFETFLMKLRRGERSLVDPTVRPRSTPALIKMVRQVGAAMAKTQAIDYQHAGETIPGDPTPHTLTVTHALVGNMAETFRAHGPSGFPQAALQAALAAILTQFGVCNQRGKPLTAAGIKGMLRHRTVAANTEDRDNLSGKP